MRAFSQITAVAAVLLRNNVDTDAIIPSREITSVSKTGLAPGLFAGWRYLDWERRIPDPAFELNDPAFRGAEVLLAGENFGCGSSREYAVWALAEYGFRVVVAPSFNTIFFRNCVRNGVLPAQIGLSEIRQIASWVIEDPQRHRVTVDLTATTVASSDGRIWPFSIAADAREALLRGEDAIARTLSLAESIAAFRDADRRRRPWVYESNRSDDLNQSK